MKINLKAIALVLGAAAVAAPAHAKEVKEVMKEINYVLPQTSITVSVSAQVTQVTPGKYAQWAKDSLGMNVPTQPETLVQLLAVNASAATEPDLSRVLSIAVGNSVPSAYTSLSKAGLILGDQRMHGAPKHKAVNPFLPKQAKQTGKKVAVDLIAEADSMAREIQKLRNARYAIITGDTDATYSGEALGAAINALQEMENKIMEDFAGTSSVQTGRIECTVVPAATARKQRIPLFTLEGTEYFLEIDKPEVGSVDKNNPDVPCITYRIPAACKITITDGTNVYFQSRESIYQMGATVRYPVLND